MTQTVAVCNQKGGVGKTSTTFHLARAAVTAGLHTLCVDLDPQANLTAMISHEPVEADQAGLADVLSDRTSDQVRDVTVPGAWTHLDLLPSTGESLGVVRDELVIASIGRERRLYDALKPVSDDYDLVLIDCPPALDQLTINALNSADTALIVTHARLNSLDGLGRLLHTIQDVRRLYNPPLTIAGIVLNQYEARTIAAQHWHDQLHQLADAHRIALLDPPIPKRTVIGDAAEAATGLDQWGTQAADLAAIYDHYLAATTKGAKQ